MNPATLQLATELGGSLLIGATAGMGPLEKAELKAFLTDWETDLRKMVFRRPEWREVPDHAEHDGFETDLWPVCRACQARKGQGLQ